MYVCDICGATISTAQVNWVPIETFQRAVRNGFNPMKTPGIDMGAVRAMATLAGNLDDWYAPWRRMVMSDTTPWGLCASCAEGFSKATSRPAAPKKAPAAAKPKAKKKATKVVRIEADSVMEAKRQAEGQVPAGLTLLSTKVVSDGSPKTAKGEGKTEEEAYSRAEAGLPAGTAILEKRTLSAPTASTVTVEARDAGSAAAEAERQKKDERDTVGEVRLVREGKKGFLGLGKTPHEYEVDVRRPAIVEVTYRPKAAVTAEYGEPKKTRAKPQAQPEAQAPAAVDDESWTPKNPQYASGRPLDKLERLFVLTSGSGEAALDSPVLLGTLEDAAEAPFARISGHVNIAVITDTDAGKVAADSGGIPDVAWEAIANIDALAQRAPSKGDGFATHSIATHDPSSGDHFLLVLVYAI